MPETHEKDMKKVLFVCKGNICRSPAAAAIFNIHAAQSSLSKYIADSAGTDPHELNMPADKRMRTVALKKNISLTSQTKKVDIALMENHDIVIALDTQVYNRLVGLRKDCQQAPLLYTLSQFDDSNSPIDITDPFWSDVKFFEKVFDRIEELCKRLLIFIKHEDDCIGIGTSPTKLAISTGWQPNKTVEDAVRIAKEESIGIELHAARSEQELSYVSHQIKTGKLECHSVHAITRPFNTSRENCCADCIVSKDELLRNETWNMIVESAGFAEEHGIPYMVLHCGDLKNILDLPEWKRGSFADLTTEGSESLHKTRLIESRRVVAFLIDSLKKLASTFPDLRIGLENRNCFWQLPGLDEMALLQKCLPSQIGFWHDIAHSRSLEVQGIVKREEWERRFRMQKLFGVHIQDSTLQGKEHLAFGRGDDTITWDCARASGVCTLEVDSYNTVSDVRKSLNLMKHHVLGSVS